jgi:hypothetical protein
MERSGAECAARSAVDSFRVYTPEEMRRIPYRTSRISAPPVAEGPPSFSALLQWMGIALLVTTVCGVGFIAVLGMTDDMKVASGGPKARMQVDVPAPKLKPPPPIVIPPSVPAVAATDFELPDDGPRRTAAKPRHGKPKGPPTGARR